jgi:hypothetical protein
MYAFPRKLACPPEMPAPARTSMPLSSTRRPRSVHDCFMMEESTWSGFGFGLGLGLGFGFGLGLGLGLGLGGRVRGRGLGG